MFNALANIAKILDSDKNPSRSVTIKQTLNIKEKEYFLTGTVTINDVKYDCLKVSKSSEFALFYALNMATGKEDYYLYDSNEQTLQRYDDELITILSKEIQEKIRKTNLENNHNYLPHCPMQKGSGAYDLTCPLLLVVLVGFYSTM